MASADEQLKQRGNLRVAMECGFLCPETKLRAHSEQHERKTTVQTHSGATRAKATGPGVLSRDRGF